MKKAARKIWRLFYCLKCWNKAIARVLYCVHGRKYHSLGEGGNLWSDRGRTDAWLQPRHCAPHD
uniref:Uncharacterized protein n=1 Tax=Siphoviridae sp. ctpnN3 TaxID=2825677 RepID=A0A8S5QDE9_9CAUD|nr:MAG TPA: hypothetical protein [Siphoviridae sp. ctpnN3]